MRFLMSVRLAAAMGLLLAAGASGCTADREQELIGKWQGDAMSATFAAVRMKGESGATQDQAEEAAKVLAKTYVDVNSDKTFTAGMGGAIAEDTWTFDKETGQAVLAIKTLKGPDGQPAAGAPASWTAILEESNRRLNFYPMPPDAVELLKQSKVKGGLSGGVSLYK